MLAMATFGSWLPPAILAARAADPPSARLVYSVAGARGCPDEAALRDAVAARLGYDAFRADADRTVRATIARGARGLRAVVELVDAGGRVAGSRVLSARGNDCRELSSAVALAISIAVDPLRFSRPAPALPACPPAPSCAPCVPCPEPPAAAASPPGEERAAAAASPPPAATPPESLPASLPARGSVRFRGSVGILGTLLATPGPSVAIAVSAGLSVRAFSISIESRLEPRLAGEPGSERGVRAAILGAALVPCYHVRGFGLCALGLAGAMLGEGFGVTAPKSATSTYGALGARAGYELPVYRSLAVKMHADVLAPLVRPTLELDGAPVWTAPPVSVVLGAHLSVGAP